MSDDIEALRALSEAATRGPWRQEPNTSAGEVWVTMAHHSDLEPATREKDWRRLFRVRSHRDNYGLTQEQVFAQREADAAFIVAATGYVRSVLAAPQPAETEETQP